MRAACVLGDCCFSCIRTGELFEPRLKALRLHPRAYHAGRWCEILAVLVLYFLTVGKLVYTEEPAVSQAQLLPLLLPLLLCAWAWALRRRAPCWGASRGARGSSSWPCPCSVFIFIGSPCARARGRGPRDDGCPAGVRVELRAVLLLGLVHVRLGLCLETAGALLGHVLGCHCESHGGSIGASMK